MKLATDIYPEAGAKVALSFVNNMDARPDCELPHHLAELGVVLWMSKDVQGWRALIDEIK